MVFTRFYEALVALVLFELIVYGWSISIPFHDVIIQSRSVSFLFFNRRILCCSVILKPPFVFVTLSIVLRYCEAVADLASSYPSISFIAFLRSSSTKFSNGYHYKCKGNSYHLDFRSSALRYPMLGYELHQSFYGPVWTENWSWK